MSHSLAKLSATALVVAGITPGMLGCASAPSAELATLEALADQCHNTQRISLIASDESGSSRGRTSEATRRRVIRDELTRTAVCGGHVQLRVFSGSVVGQVVLDSRLSTSGTTETARLRKVPRLVEETTEGIEASLPDALAKLPIGSTDTTAQYQVAAEYFAQARPTGGTASMEFTVLTDGISTVPAGLTDPKLAATEATRLARTVTPAQLPGVAVRIIGVGRTSGDEQLTSTYVDALKAFQTEVCRASHAASCLIVTDPEPGGAK